MISLKGGTIPPVILVISSNLETRRMLLRSLKAMGFEAFGATNGRQGLALIGMQASKNIGGILLDLEMFDLEGMAVLHTLQEQHADIPVIVVSCVSTKERAEEVLRKGARDYIVKPFDIRLLRDKCLQCFIHPEDNAV